MRDCYCVYMHIFPNGKKYVGQTKQKPEYRWNHGDGYKIQPYLYNAIKKYGWDNISHEIIIDGIDRELADKWEDILISLHHTSDKKYGYNLRSGGTSGYEYTEEVKAKMSSIQKGKRQSEETKKKRSDALRKYYAEHKVSKTTKQKIRIKRVAQKPHKLSEKQREVAINNIKPHQYKIGHAPSEKSIKTLKEKYSKSVIQYDLQGNKVAEYSSLTEASVINNLSKNAVGNCVRGYTLTTNGFFWRYAEDALDLSTIDKDKIYKSIKTYNQKKKILCLTSDGEIVKEYDSISDAKRMTGLLHISAVLRGKRKTAGGYIWRYAE